MNNVQPATFEKFISKRKDMQIEKEQNYQF